MHYFDEIGGCRSSDERYQKLATTYPGQLRRDMVLKDPIRGYHLELVVSVHAVTLRGSRGTYQRRLNQETIQCLNRYIGKYSSAVYISTAKLN